MMTRLKLFWQNPTLQAVLLLPATLSGVALLSDIALQLGAWVSNDIAPTAMLATIGVAWVALAATGLICSLLALVLACLVFTGLRLSNWKRSFIQVLQSTTFAGSTLIGATALWYWATTLQYFQTDISAPMVGVAVGVQALTGAIVFGVPEAYRLFIHRLSLVLLVPAVLGLGCLVDELQETTVASGPTSSGTPPYIFVLTIDSLSAKHMSLYGYGRKTTPNLDVLAQDSVVFDRLYASSNWTVPGIGSLLTGTRPWTHRGINMGSGPLRQPYDTGLFAMTKALGYTNSAYVTNFNASPRTHGGSQWFDRIRYPLAPISSLGLEWPWVLFDRQPLTMGWHFKISGWLDSQLGALGLTPATGNWSPARTFTSLLTDVRKDANAKDGRHLYWAHFYPPHSPYAAPAPFLGKFDSSPKGRTRFNSSPTPYQAPQINQVYLNRYDEAIAYVDHEFGQFINELKAMGIYDQSLIVVTADHGESFTHSYTAHGGPGLHQELIAIPLIMKLPGSHVMQRVWGITEQIDILPTLGDILGLRPEQAHWEGTSMAPALAGGIMPQHPVFSMNLEGSKRLSALDTGSVAIIDDHWKYIHRMGNMPGSYSTQQADTLFNLQSDPDEQLDATAAHPDIAGRLRNQLHQQLELHRKVQYAR